MRKIILPLLFGIIALILILPFGMSVYIKYTLQNRLNQLNLPNITKIFVKHYKIGWLDSSATLKIHIKFPQIMDAKKIIEKTATLKVHIFNGPLFLNIQALRHNDWFGRSFMTGILSISRLSIPLRIYWHCNNNLSLHFVVPKTIFSDKQHRATLSFDQFELNVNIKNNNQLLIAHSTLTNLHAKNKHEALYMSQIETHATLHKQANDLWLRNKITHIPLIILDEQSKTILNIFGLAIKLNQLVQQGTLTTMLQATFSKVMVHNNVTAGPGIIKITCEHMDLKAYKALQDQMHLSRKAGATSFNALLQLLKGSTIHLLIAQLDTPKGSGNISGNIIFPNNNHPQKILRDTTVNILLKAQKQAFLYLMKLDHKQFTRWLNLGYISLEKNNVSSKLSYDNHDWLINNHPPFIILQKKLQQTGKGSHNRQNLTISIRPLEK